ncbi:MAG: hypothetical protein AAF493_12945 [Pseudomonadota bacterium]
MPDTEDGFWNGVAADFSRPPEVDTAKPKEKTLAITSMSKKASRGWLKRAQ